MIKHLVGDCREILPTLRSRSVHCCVTSPPYWGLRDYGVDGQIGLERTPEEYVATLIGVFREVRRVLRDDGTLWLNLGDSYAGSWGNQGRKPGRGTQRPINGGMLTPVHDGRYPDKGTNTGTVPPGLKSKDLVGIPWRVAFALQADGWYLRSDIIWAKPNPMPESVKDRPTKAHEYLFLLTKSERYYYDARAIAERCIDAGVVVSLGKKSFSKRQADGAGIKPSGNGNASIYTVKPTRNSRSVWTLTPQPFKGAHFAVMPEVLVKRCIKAGTGIGDTVLDPFSGAGTVGVVAEQLKCDSILIELNPSYVALARRRTTARPPRSRRDWSASRY